MQARFAFGKTGLTVPPLDGMEYAFIESRSAGKLRSSGGNEQYLREIADIGLVVDQWQLEKLAQTGLKHEVFFYAPGVSRAELGALGVRCFTELSEAVDRFMDGLAAGARVALLPEGPYSFARVAG